MRVGGMSGVSVCTAPVRRVRLLGAQGKRMLLAARGQLGATREGQRKRPILRRQLGARPSRSNSSGGSAVRPCRARLLR